MISEEDDDAFHPALWAKAAESDESIKFLQIELLHNLIICSDWAFGQALFDCFIVKFVSF